MNIFCSHLASYCHLSSLYSNFVSSCGHFASLCNSLASLCGHLVCLCRHFSSLLSYFAVVSISLGFRSTLCVCVSNAWRERDSVGRGRRRCVGVGGPVLGRSRCGAGCVEEARGSGAWLLRTHEPPTEAHKGGGERERKGEKQRGRGEEAKTEAGWTWRQKFKLKTKIDPVCVSDAQCVAVAKVQYVLLSNTRDILVIIILYVLSH